MSTKFDKPYKTNLELIEILKDRNISINNDAIADRIISGISYYSLVNSNKDIFCKDPDKDIYKQGVQIEHLYYAHVAQKSIYTIVLKYIIYVETSFKTALAEQVSANFGVKHQGNVTHKNDNFLFYKNYSPSSKKRKNICISLVNAIKKLCEFRENSSVAYYHKHKNHIPPWIVARDISFGLAIQWYGILPSNLKDTIVTRLITEQLPPEHEMSNNMQGSKEFMSCALNLFREWRNPLAHGDKPLYSKFSSAIPYRAMESLLPRGMITKTMYKNGSGKNDFLAIVTCLLAFLFNDAMKLSLLQELKAQIKVYKDIDYGPIQFHKLIGMPDDVLEQLKILIEAL